MEWLSRLISIFPNPLNLAVAVSLLGLLILFGPTDALGLTDFVAKHREYLLIAWLLAVILVVVEAVPFIYKQVSSAIRRRIQGQKINDRLANLAPNEAAVVREFVLRQAAAELLLNDPAVTALFDDGVLVRVGGLERKASFAHLSEIYWHFRLSPVANQNLDPKALGLDQFLPDDVQNSRYASPDLLQALEQESIEWMEERRPSYLRPREKKPTQRRSPRR